MPKVGGRYSVLSPFGMVPAALIGLDLGGFCAASQVMVVSCGADVPPAANPGVQLGVILGAAAKAGRDKVTILASEGIGPAGRLAGTIARRVHRQGRQGLIPVDAEPCGDAGVYGDDRLFIDFRLEGDR